MAAGARKNGKGSKPGIVESALTPVASLVVLGAATVEDPGDEVTRSGRVEKADLRA